MRLTDVLRVHRGGLVLECKRKGVVEDSIREIEEGLEVVDGRTVWVDLAVTEDIWASLPHFNSIRYIRQVNLRNYLSGDSTRFCFQPSSSRAIDWQTH
jgi:hypothetical protein